MKCSCKWWKKCPEQPCSPLWKDFSSRTLFPLVLLGIVNTVLELGRSSTSFYLLAGMPMDNSEPCFLQENQVSYFSQWKVVWNSTTDMLIKFWNITYSHLGIQSLPSQFTAIYIYIYIFTYTHTHTHTHTHTQYIGLYTGLTLQLVGSQLLDQGLNLYPW